MEEPTRKKIRKKKSGVSKNDDGTTQSNENTLESNTYLPYDILRLIFQYLNARNLTSAAMVCTSWLEAANKEEWTRSDPCCFIQRYMRQNALCHIQNIRIKPSVGFFFVSSDTSRAVEDRIEALLPKHCEIIILYSEGIIMDEEIKYLPFPNMVCAFLPQIPNVRVKSFNLPESYIIQKTAEYQEIISTIVNNETSTSNHETCFMVFCYLEGKSCITAKRWASAIQQSKKNEVISIWGGVVNDIHAQRAHIGLCKGRTRIGPRDGSHGYCVAVLITGPIQTWILNLQYCTKERAEERLKLFKDEVKLKKHSVGFMFTCKIRCELYDEANVESTIFKRLFPTVPLVGCSSDIGNWYTDEWEFVKPITFDEVNEEKNSREEQNCDECKLRHNALHFSTLFLILTYG